MPPCLEPPAVLEPDPRSAEHLIVGLDHASVRVHAPGRWLLTVIVARRADTSGLSGSRSGSRLLPYQVGQVTAVQLWVTDRGSTVVRWCRSLRGLVDKQIDKQPDPTS